MKKYKNKVNTIVEPTIDDENKDDNDKIDPNSLEVVVDRVEHGLIGSLRITDDINAPLFKEDDIVHIRIPAKLEIKDFVLYKNHEDYFIRRIIKHKEEDIYVAGDNEKEYHIIHKEDVVGKVLARDRKTSRISFTLVKPKKFYTFRKVNLAYFRLKNRIINYEQEVNNESLELAMQKAAEQAALATNTTVFSTRKVVQTNIDLDSDLASFIDPDSLVDALNSSTNQPSQEDEVDIEAQVDQMFNNRPANADNTEDVTDETPGEEDGETEEQVVYVDEDGNEIDYQEGEVVSEDTMEPTEETPTETIVENDNSSTLFKKK